MSAPVLFWLMWVLYLGAEPERTHSLLSSRLQQDPRPLWFPQGNAKGSAQSPGPGMWILKPGCGQGAKDKLQVGTAFL